MFESNEINLKCINKKYALFEMENFYKNPIEVLKYTIAHTPYIHKNGEKNSLNGIDFLDLRHAFDSNEFLITEKKLYNYLKIPFLRNSPDKNIRTNMFQNLKKQDYINNYWWPHEDHCTWTGLIYLNPEECDGTNIYERFERNEGEIEHANPWQNKKKFKLIENFKSKFNKLIVFPGKVTHGMAVNSEKFFNTYRLNQVIFI
jgi:hypothetical protein